MSRPSRHVSTVIRRSPAEVYDFAADPANLRSWAAGLARGEITIEAGVLSMESPMGRVSVRFVERNDHGVLDHEVTLPSGATVLNPVRVLAHPDGAEVVFTVRQLDLSDEQFAADVEAVASDLDQLRSLLES